MTLRRLLGLLLLFTVGLPISAAAFQLVYPEDGTSVAKSNYLILKAGQEPQIDGVTIAINGVDSPLLDISTPQYKASFSDMLIVEPLFDPGENYIQIVGFRKGKPVARLEATVYFLDRLDAQAPGRFRPYTFHLAAREQLCAGCHNMNPDASELTAGPPTTHPCGSCHARMINRPHVHGPAGVFDCTFCHQVDSWPAKYQARAGDATVCLECHDDMQEGFRSAGFVHGPIEAKLCLACHDPHASDHRAQLRLAAYDLCVMCHARVAAGPHVTRGSTGKQHPLQGESDPAVSGQEFSCASCHDPHKGKVPAMFKWGVTSRFGLCAKCHEK